MIFNVQLVFLLLAAVAPFFTNAAIVRLYRDLDCVDETIEINVKDNTCADWPKEGWRSYKLMTRGGPGQKITSYPGSACVYPGIQGSCVDAVESNVGSCHINPRKRRRLARHRIAPHQLLPQVRQLNVMD